MYISMGRFARFVFLVAGLVFADMAYVLLLYGEGLPKRAYVLMGVVQVFISVYFLLRFLKADYNDKTR